MKNLPIRRESHVLLKKKGVYTGVFEIKGRGKYLKLSSQIEKPPVLVSFEEDSRENALKKVIKCAKVYKRLIQEGLYHPQTRIAVYEDCGYFGLLVLMPELKRDDSDQGFKSIRERWRNLEKRLGFDLNVDLYAQFNWGYDDRLKEYYAYDMHIVREDTPIKSYEELMKIAEMLGIK